MLLTIKKIFQQVAGIAILFGFLAGLLVVIFVPVEMYKMREVREWSSRQGTITHSSMTLTGGRGSRHAPYWKPEIGGVYRDNGEKFWIARVRYGSFTFGAGKADVAEIIAKYPVGKTVSVYYSPSRRKDTVLEPLASWDTMQITLAIGVTFFLLPFVLYLFRKQFGHQHTGVNCEGSPL